MPQTLAQAIKAKYPGQYDDVSDADLEAKVTAKYPGVYDDMPRTAGAARAQASTSTLVRDERGRALAIPQLPLGVEMDPSTTEGKINNALMIAAGGVSAVRAAGGVVPALINAGKSAVGAWVGGKVGGELGGWVGAPNAGRAIGATVGGVGAPMVNGSTLLSLATGGKSALLKAALGAGEGGAVTAEQQAAAKLATAQAEADISAKQALAQARTAQAARAETLRQQSMERHALQQALLKQRLAGKAPLNTPAPAADVPTVEAAPAVSGALAEAPAPTILPDSQRAMATNLGGVAQPGPAATPQDQLESLLQASIDKFKAQKAAAAANALQAPRIQVGAQQVGRDVGMTKEAVRRVAGPVLDEAVGEASPILPKQALQNIIDTMKGMPVAQREAYVARATSGKTRWQVENIRRTLEHLGLLLPAGLAVGAMGSDEQ